MSRVVQARSDIRALVAEAQTLTTARMSVARKTARMAQIEAAVAERKTIIETWAAAAPNRLIGAGDSLEGMTFPGAGGSVFGAGVQRVAPLTLTEPVMKGLHSAAVSRQTLRVDTKAGADNLTGYVPPTLAPLVGRIVEPTRVATLFPGVALDTPVVTFPQITGQTGNAGPTAPGGEKPLIGLNTNLLTVPAVKLAGLMTVNDESLQDFPDFSTIVSAELMRSVVMAENTQILTGSGVGTNMLGIVTAAGLTRTAAAGESVLDTVEQALTDVRVGSAYAKADGIVIHPADWSALRRAKDTQGRYLLAPDPTESVTPTLWGCNVIETTDMPQGTAVVGAFALGALLYVRLGMVVQASSESGTNFETNRTTLRCELREALAVTRPAAFCKVTLTPAA